MRSAISPVAEPHKLVGFNPASPPTLPESVAFFRPLG
jgi:hypothetical protein